MKKRVVITGMGVITPLGTCIKEFWNAIVEGRSGIKNITRFNIEGFPVKIAGEVHGFQPENFFSDDKWIEWTYFPSLPLPPLIRQRITATSKYEEE